MKDVLQKKLEGLASNEEKYNFTREFLQELILQILDRKGFFKNINNLRLEIGDIVAVEASPGHDIGRISMVGPLLNEQLKRLKVHPFSDDLKKVYRKAKAVDIIKWEEAKKVLSKFV